VTKRVGGQRPTMMSTMSTPLALRLSQIRSATTHDFLSLICEYVLWPKIKEEYRHEADGARDVTDLPMITLRQFRSGDLNALCAIALATGHEGGDVGAPGGGRANSEDQPHAK
jgi:hypothetical protein